MEDQKVTVETASKVGLAPQEYDKIREILGRDPNFTELSIFSVMWSEHCCYKNSIYWLKKLPKEGKMILAGAGEENAGLVDIGDGYACAFKIESHNHPSAIEPYQGAATGVGGIHRDIFTMGARPVAAMNSLRFGDLSLNKTRRLFNGVVRGIGDYGNSFGVPTVGGEVYFDRSYNINPLINAMSVGVVEKGKTISAVAKTVGNPVYIVGSSTGKDGIHGATFASEDITEESVEDLPSVQVGDPFQEKLLLEATLEVVASGAVEGMQDMGAAGITCSTSEMAEKGGVGMDIYLEKVPVRQENMKPFELLLSESQERMLVVVKQGREKEVEAIFEKWDLKCAVIGKVTPRESGLQYWMHDELVARVPAEALVLGGGAPVYKREVKTPEYFHELKHFDPGNIPVPDNLSHIGKMLAGHPNIASRQWVAEQYDSMVQTNNMSTNSPSDAPVVRLKGTKKALVVSTDCNSHYIYADPEKGAAIAVAEAARNISCSGAKPVAITNCLNFGSPLNPEVYWQFAMTVKGMSRACKLYDTPVTGGNVSFYNQSPGGGPVLATPVIGMLGILEDLNHKVSLDFKKTGDPIYLLGEPSGDINASQYLMQYHGVRYSPAPYFDLEKDHHLSEGIQNLTGEDWLLSAHDISEGGLFITALESGIFGNKGFEINTVKDIRKDGFLFGEAQGRVVVTVDAANADPFESRLKALGIPCQLLGKTTAEQIKIDGDSWGSIGEYAALYNESLDKEMEAYSRVIENE